MNTKTLLNITLFCLTIVCGYKKATAMNTPLSLTKYACLGLLAYSPMWAEQ